MENRALKGKKLDNRHPDWKINHKLTFGKTDEHNLQYIQRSSKWGPVKSIWIVSYFILFLSLPYQWGNLLYLWGNLLYLWGNLYTVFVGQFTVFVEQFTVYTVDYTNLRTMGVQYTIPLNCSNNFTLCSEVPYLMHICITRTVSCLKTNYMCQKQKPLIYYLNLDYMYVLIPFY